MCYFTSSFFAKEILTNTYVTFIQSKTHKTAIRYVGLLMPLAGIVKIGEELCCFLYIRPCVLFFPSFLDPLLSLHYIVCSSALCPLLLCNKHYFYGFFKYFPCVLLRLFTHSETFSVCASLLLVFFFTALILVILKICQLCNKKRYAKQGGVEIYLKMPRTMH